MNRISSLFENYSLFHAGFWQDDLIETLKSRALFMTIIDFHSLKSGDFLDDPLFIHFAEKLHLYQDLFGTKLIILISTFPAFIKDKKVYLIYYFFCFSSVSSLNFKYNLTLFRSAMLI